MLTKVPKIEIQKKQKKYDFHLEKRIEITENFSNKESHPKKILFPFLSDNFLLLRVLEVFGGFKLCFGDSLGHQTGNAVNPQKMFHQILKPGCLYSLVHCADKFRMLQETNFCEWKEE